MTGEDKAQGGAQTPGNDPAKDQSIILSAGGSLLAWIKDQTSKPSEKEGGFVKFLNSPFSLTIVSGLGIWLLTTNIQNRHTEKEAQKESSQKVFDKKIELAARFADVTTRFLQTSFSMRKREVWIAQRQELPLEQRVKQSYPDGRNYTGTRDYYEKEKENFDKIEHPLAILSQLNGYFTDSISARYILGIRKDLKTYLQLTDQDSLDLISDRIDNFYKAK